MMPSHIVLVAIVLGEIANSVEPNWLSPLLQIPIGIVLAWFMLRAEKKIDEQSQSNRMQARAIERNSMALMTAVLAMKNIDGNLSDLAKELHREAQQACDDDENHTGGR
jgi:hypothetical protein